MKIIIVLGATGGHIYPGIVLGKKLKNKGHKIQYIGKKNLLTLKVKDKENLDIIFIPAEGLKRSKGILQRGFSIILYFYNLILNLIFSLYIVARNFPDLIVGMGGYLSVPVVLSGVFLSIPIHIHEQNLLPGLSNKFLSIFAKKVTVGFYETANFFPNKKVVFTGNPIRNQIIECNRNKGEKRLRLHPAKFNILVFGGSQGAKKINDVFISALKLMKQNLLNRIQIIHITGQKHWKYIKGKYQDIMVERKIFKYLNEIEFAYSVADLVVSRSGAMTVSEILIKGINSILIPYPYATEGHQMINAKYLAKKGLAYIIEEKELTPNKLSRLIITIIEKVEEKEVKRDVSEIYPFNPVEKIIKEIEDFSV